MKLIQEESPGTPVNTIRGATHQLFQDSQQVVRVAPGTYQLEKYANAEAKEAQAEDEATASIPVQSEGSQSVTEQDFYASFAEWLVEENDETTFAAHSAAAALEASGAPQMLLAS